MVVKIGDMFVTSWGYDQTQHDFIVVVGSSGSGKTVICKRCGVDVSIDGFRKPNGKVYGKPFRMRIEKNENYPNNEYLRGSYPFYDNNDSAKRLDTFRRVNEGGMYYDTPPGFGH